MPTQDEYEARTLARLGKPLPGNASLSAQRVHKEQMEIIQQGKGPAVSPHQPTGTNDTHKNAGLAGGGAIAAGLILLFAFASSGVRNEPPQSTTHNPQKTPYTAPANEYPAPQAPPPAAALSVPEDPHVLFRTMMAEYYRARGITSPEMEQRLSDLLASAPQSTIRYAEARGATGAERSIVSANPAGGITRAFICSAQNNRITSLVHATATPAANGAYTITFSQTIPHYGYLRGLNLMQGYGQHGSCKTALNALNSDLNGAEELGAFSPR